MDDWESEDFVPPPPSIAREKTKSQWDDEDAPEEEDVKESWEDEENPKPTKAPAPAPVKGKAEKKKAVDIKKEAEPEAKKVPLTLEEEAANKLQEKLRQQRLVEESDYQATTELFGNKAGDRTLENFIPKSESDFLEYAELLAQKIRPYEKSYHYLTLLKTTIRHSMSSLKAADAKDIASSVTVIANEKLKAEKEAAGKKKTGAKKKQLHVDKADDDVVYTTYDDADEYDFM